MTVSVAGCVITDKAGRVLLIHRNTPRLTQWELPGGKLEPGEDLAAAAMRECQEEIGVVVHITRKIGDTEFDDNGTRWAYTWFGAEIVSGEPKVGEPDRYDGCEYFDLMDPKLSERGISINIVDLISALKSGAAKI